MRLPVNRPFDSSTISGLHSAPGSRNAGSRRTHQVFPNTVDLALTGALHYGRWN